MTRVPFRNKQCRMSILRSATRVRERRGNSVATDDEARLEAARPFLARDAPFDALLCRVGTNPPRWRASADEAPSPSERRAEVTARDER